MSEAPTTPRAVFLSYAREDSDAARRLADALRAFGVEVWFDQNELRGGDAWDQKIRSQIRTCTLCVPVISAATQARGEGYFRREWKIAVERMQDMAAGVPFLMPVVIDETRENEATVPEEFLKVQWTRMPRGVPTPQFVEQVRASLEKPRARASEASRTPAPEAGAAQARSNAHFWIAGALVAVGVAIVAALVVTRRPAPVAAAPASAAPAANDKSIAVLPFTNMSDDKDSGFFADGIHEDILTNLALVRDFRVVSRTSVMPYRTTSKSIRQIAQELGVAYILEGSVRRSGNRVRVTGQLIRAASDEHVWAQAYDRDLTDVFGIQAELSQQIAGALQTALSPEEKVLIAHRPTEKSEAYELFLRARDVSNRMGNTLAALNEREALVKRVVEIDPNYAAAWGELAHIEALYVFWGHDQSEARKARAKEAIDTAMRLGPGLPDVIDAYASYLYYGERDYLGAFGQYERLARQHPNDPSYCSAMGLIARRQGRWPEAIANLRRATQLDPGNASYSRNYAETLLGCRRYDDYVVEQRRKMGLLPEDTQEAFALAAAPFIIRASTAEADQFLAHLPPEKANSESGIDLRRQWAREKGDWAEAVRLDKLLPFYDGDGEQHYVQAFQACITLMAAGDMAAARARAGDFPEEVRRRLAQEPDNWALLLYGTGYALILGRDEEALRLARHAVEILPESRDAVDGPVCSLVLAYAHSWTGHKDEAIEELRHLFRVPVTNSFNVHDLAANPFFTPLHGDPRFEALLADPANNAPLY
jgi:TolB-like protein/Tfp pilus assembly protein PilF